MAKKIRTKSIKLRYVIKDNDLFVSLFFAQGYKTKAAISRRLKVSVSTVFAWLNGVGVNYSWVRAITSGLQAKQDDLYEALTLDEYRARRKQSS